MRSNATATPETTPASTSETTKVLKDGARKAGALTQKALDSANTFAEQHQVKERAKVATNDLLTKAAEKYEDKTGRSAKADGAIIAASAAATATIAAASMVASGGAMAMAALPAALVVTAVGGIAVNDAKDMLQTAEDKYGEATKRDPSKDKDAIKKTAKSAAKTAIELKDEFKQGMAEEKAKTRPPAYSP